MGDQQAVPVVYMRGGTSKGAFLHERDVPPPGGARDAMALEIMGSPDVMQIDGMGGAISSTSKVVIVGSDPDGLVRYTFGQVGIAEPSVDWRSNCGNLTSAVGGFAIDEGLVPATEPTTTVRLLNENTGVRIDAELRVRDGRAAVRGDTVVDGVPGTGAPVHTRYLQPEGGVFDAALPAGAAQHRIVTARGSVSASLVDVVAPYLLVAADAGLPFDPFARSVAELNADVEFLGWAEELRVLGAALVRDARVTASPTIPRIAFVRRGRADASVQVRALSMGSVHRAVPITGALCIAGATALPGTVVALDRPVESAVIRVEHPRGSAEVSVERGSDGSIGAVGVTRTARRILSGEVWVAAPSGEPPA